MPASPALAGISVSGLPGFYIGFRVSAVTGSRACGRVAEQVLSLAEPPNRLAKRRPRQVTACPVSIRKPEIPARLSLVFWVVLSRLWESNPRPIHYFLE